MADLKITQVKLDTKTPPFLRKLDLITKQAVSIIILSENKATIDIGLLHAADQASGQPMIRHHYYVKNGTADGEVFYCRPRIYQNGLPTDNPTGENLQNNSITVSFAGLWGQNLTAKQETTFVDLLTMLVRQEMVTLDKVVFYPEITTGKVQIPNFQTLKDNLKAVVEGENFLKALAIPPTENTILQLSSFDTFNAVQNYDSFSRIAAYLNMPEFTLASMNKSVVDGNKIPWGTVILIPATPEMAKLRAMQTAGVLSTIRNQVDSKIQTATIARGNYGKPNSGEDLYGADTTFLTTQYAGKRSPIWNQTPMEFPGYHNAFIQFTDNSTNIVAQTIAFMISPASSSEQRSTSQQMSKTNAGWFVMRTGKNPGTISISGYMLDLKKALERHEFLNNYKQYIEDIRNERLEFTNKYSMKLRVEGRDYHGYVQNISFTKSSVQPFLYQYQINFAVLNDKFIYDPRYAAVSSETVTNLLNTGKPQSSIAGVSNEDITNTTYKNVVDPEEFNLKLPYTPITTKSISPACYKALNAAYPPGPVIEQHNAPLTAPNGPTSSYPYNGM